MAPGGRHHTRGRWLVIFGLLASVGCESPLSDTRTGPGRQQARQARAVSSARLAQEAAAPAPPEELPSQPVGPTDTQPALAIDDISSDIPDPADLPAVLARELDQKLKEVEENERLTRQQKDQQQADRKAEYERRVPGILERLQAIRRPETVRLSFTDAIRRALRNNYAIQMQSYSPAIEATRIVEAEAQFDAVYFASFTNNKQDRPSSSELQGTAYEVRDFESGVRKLLSAGTQVQVSYALNRTQTDLVFQTLNPSYFNSFVVEFRQPFLRGFGLDVNRAQIEISKLDREMSIEHLRRDVRELVYNVEQAYWQLLQARRAITISSQLLADLEIIHHFMEQRVKAGYDFFKVQLSLPSSRIERHQAEFIRLCNTVKNTEDALKRLMNDPDLNLSQDVAILPTDVPSVESMILDQVDEVTAALLHRSELHEARLAIEQAQIAVGLAKNQALPRFDVLFRYIVDGLGANPDSAFSQLSENDFHEYFIMLEFEWPIGNRGPEAALRQARLQQAQAIAAHRDAIENVILEVQQAVRDLRSNYDQIGPNFRSTIASKEWVEVTKARQERKDPLTLEQELNAHESLAGAREQLLQSLVNYNIALTNLERQKGTLLEYNNVVIQGADDESYLDPYRPVGP